MTKVKHKAQKKTQTNGIAYLAIDCILQIFCRAITVSNCTHLYMWPLYVHTLSRSPLIFMRAHLNPRGGPGNIQSITDRFARGCACVPVCQCVWVPGCGYEEVPIFCGISIMITDGLLLIWPPGHLQLHCSSSSDGCNYIRWNEWFC